MECILGERRKRRGCFKEISFTDISNIYHLYVVTVVSPNRFSHFHKDVLTLSPLSKKYPN